MTNKGPITYLLDANVLVALTVADHLSHSRVLEWFHSHSRFATCPITQGALVRFHCRMAGIALAKRVLDAITRLDGHEFWSDDLGYGDIQEHGLVSHKQVTDFYLAALAKAHKGKLASMDESLCALHKLVCVRV